MKDSKVFMCKIFCLKFDEPVDCATSFKILINVLGFLKLIPFQIEKVSFPVLLYGVIPYPEYSLRPTYLGSKVLCAVFQFGGIVIGIWQIYSLLSGIDGIGIGGIGKAAFILRAISDISEFFEILLICQLFWLNPIFVVDVVNALAVPLNTRSTDKNTTLFRINAKWKAYLLVFVIVGSSFFLGMTSVHQQQVITNIADWILQKMDNFVGLIYLPGAIENLSWLLRIVLKFWIFFSFRLTTVFEVNLIMVLMYAMSLLSNKFVNTLNQAAAIDQVGFSFQLGFFKFGNFKFFQTFACNISGHNKSS